jgi:hypothetical protein
MAATSLGAGDLSKSRGAETGMDFSVLGIGWDMSAAITKVLKVKEPRKTWGFLCDLLWVTSRHEMTERVAKHRLAGSREYSVDELRMLIQSEDGADFLSALMADAEPRWWVNFKKSLKLSVARALQEEAQQAVLSLESGPMDKALRRKTKRFFDADRNLSAARAKEETAVGFLHQDHARAMAGSVAETKTKAKPALRAYAGRGR